MSFIGIYVTDIEVNNSKTYWKVTLLVNKES